MIANSLSLAAFAPPPEPVRWHPGLDTGVRHVEVLADADEAGGVAFALALAGMGHGEDHRPWLWVQDKAAIARTGRPCRAGLPPHLRHRLIHVAAARPEDALFAIEEGVRCRDLAFVLGEIAGNPAALDFTASRRLSLAAERHGVGLWLVRPGARRDASSARMRWQVASAPGAPAQWNAQGPGRPRWRAELFRAHRYQPGEWMVESDEHACARIAAPDHGDLAAGAGDRALAAERRRA